MNGLRWYLRITRPLQVASAFFATWVTATLCQAGETERFYASLAMSLGVLGASLFHFGAANKVYARKHWDLVEINRPSVLKLLGFLCFMVSIWVADFQLPAGSTVIVGFNALAIVLYGYDLSRHWTTKNLTIALACTTPLLMGWWIGKVAHPLTWPLLACVFCGYFAREVVKDIQDREANCGIRVTFPLRWGNSQAAFLAGVLTFASSAIIFAQLLLVPGQSTGTMCGLALAGGAMLGASLNLLAIREPDLEPHYITVAMASLIVAFL